MKVSNIKQSSIEQSNKQIQKHKRLNDMNELQLQAVCDHKKNFAPYVKNVNGKFFCRKCNEEISVESIDEQKLEDAIDTVINTINLIKLSTYDLNKSDGKVLKELARIKMGVQTTLPRLYKMVETGAVNKQKNQKERKERSEQSMWALK